MDRRNFLKTGGIALLGSLATGSAMALTTPGALGGEGADKKAAVALAMNHFGVSEADLKKVLAAALEKGGDYADLFFEHTISNSIRLMDGAVNNSYSNIDYGGDGVIERDVRHGHAQGAGEGLEDGFGLVVVVVAVGRDLEVAPRGACERVEEVAGNMRIFAAKRQGNFARL